MKTCKTFAIFIVLFLFSGICAAQFLAANKIPSSHLTQEILARWIKTNNELHTYQAVIDEMLPTDAEAKAFELLTWVEQDKIVNTYLQKKGIYEPLHEKIKQLGWKSVADYMRSCSQIGNALAAYFQGDIVARMPPDQAKAMMENVDPAVKAVTKEDLEFVRANIKTIRAHIQGYAK